MPHVGGLIWSATLIFHERRSSTMFFIDRLDLDRRMQVLRKEIAERGISEELRGWNFHSPPVQPVGPGLLFGVGELASRYCPTMRDIWLKRVARVKPPPNVKMVRGIAYHEVVHRTTEMVKRAVYEAIEVTGSNLVELLLEEQERVANAAVYEAEISIAPLEDEVRAKLVDECRDLFRFLVVQAGAKLDTAISKYPHSDRDGLLSVAIPPVTERKVDGSLVGLAHELSVDIYTPFNAIADLKTGEVRKFHPYTAAGYALAVEAEEGVEVNYGFIIYLRMEGRVPRIRYRYFLVGDELRREFLDIRDEAYEIVSSGKDPGMPARCPDYCPYYPVCRGGEVEAGPERARDVARS